MVIAKKETECHLALQISVIHKQLAEALLIKALVLPMSELCFLGFFFIHLFYLFNTRCAYYESIDVRCLAHCCEQNTLASYAPEPYIREA